MCGKCFLRGIDQFTTWQNFEAFAKILQGKVSVGQLELIDKPTSSTNDIMAAEAYYKCSNCQEVWALSSPDNAWRGYFLSIEQANARTQQIETSDRAKRVGCLILIIAALLFALWQSTH